MHVKIRILTEQTRVFGRPVYHLLDVLQHQLHQPHRAAGLVPVAFTINTTKVTNKSDQHLDSMFSPEVIRPSSRVDLNETSTRRGGKRKRRRAILTSTPKKLELEEAATIQAQERETKFFLKEKHFAKMLVLQMKMNSYDLPRQLQKQLSR
jgi:hypothetical protein